MRMDEENGTPAEASIQSGWNRRLANDVIKASSWHETVFIRRAGPPWDRPALRAAPECSTPVMAPATVAVECLDPESAGEWEGMNTLPVGLEMLMCDFHKKTVAQFWQGPALAANGE